jgi:peptidoglycan/xylan/chitin deacetylase (PgdA/CDA1 family)
MITFSFDDGRECTFNSAIPILDTAGFKSTNYIITKRLTGTDYITGAKVRVRNTWSRNRYHTPLTHPLSPTELQNEIEGAKQDLLVLGVKKVETLAYPFGAYNIGIAEFISSAGYLGARTTDEGGTLPSTNRFALKRRNLGGAVTISDVQSWVNVAVANREWLIMTSHHVDYSPNDYSITPDLFRQIVDLVVSKRLRVVTISEGLKVM